MSSSSSDSRGSNQSDGLTGKVWITQTTDPWAFPGIFTLHEWLVLDDTYK